MTRLGVWFVTVAIGCAAIAGTAEAGHPSRPEKPDTARNYTLYDSFFGPRVVYGDTTLIDGNQAFAIILHPDEPGYAELAIELSEALKKETGVKIPFKSHQEFDEHDQASHILSLGNSLHTPLAMNLFLMGLFEETDGTVSTIADPWGTGRNVIILGGRNLDVVRLSVHKAFLADVVALLPRRTQESAWNRPPQAIHQLKPSHPRTVLVEAGKPRSLIIHPDKPGYAEAARELAESIRNSSGAVIPVKSDRKYTDADRAETLICLGRMNNNRLALDLYFWRYIVSDDWFPGPGGYELRTVTDPWGTGRNVIMLGGSNLQGVRAAVKAFEENIPDGSDLIFPYTMDTRFKGIEHLDAFMETDARRYRELYRETGNLIDSDRSVDRVTEPGRILLECASMYYLTGRDEYALAWAEMMRDFMQSYYTFSRFRQLAWTKYTMPALIRSFDLVGESAVIPDAFKLEVANLIFDNVSRRSLGRYVINLQAAGHFVRFAMHNFHKSIPYGYDYFKKYYPEADLERLEIGMQSVLVGHETVASAGGFLERRGGYTASFADAPIKLAAVLGDDTYFNSGAGRDWMRYAMAGSGAHGRPFFYGGSGRGRIDSFPLAAWYYQDPEYTWFVNQVTRASDYSPEMTETGFRRWLWSYLPKREPVEPSGFVGTQAIPMHKANILHIKHDTRKTVGFPPERAFHYVTMRERFRGGQYLRLLGINDGIVAGYKGDGNAVFDGGRYGLEGAPQAHNTALIKRQGDPSGRMPALSDLQLTSDMAETGFIRSVMHDYSSVDWARSIAWIKGRYWVVFDQFKTRQSGTYDLRTQWQLGTKNELPQPDAFNRFRRLRGQIIQFAGGALPELGNFRGEVFFLQNVHAGPLAAGARHDFAQLHYAYPDEGLAPYVIARVGDGRVVVSEPDRQVLMGVAPLSGDAIRPETAAYPLDILPGIRATCVMFHAAPDGMSFAGLTRLEGANVVLESDEPVDVSMDMTSGIITAYTEAPANLRISGLQPAGGNGNGWMLPAWQAAPVAYFQPGEDSPFGGPAEIAAALAGLAPHPEAIRALNEPPREPPDATAGRAAERAAIWGTPLHWAAYMGHAEAARRLIRQGIDVNARDQVGRAPLHRAAAMGHHAVIEVLIDAGADINARGDDGSVPLHWAVYLTTRDGPQTVELLLRKGADPNLARANGVTPLHLAAALDSGDLKPVIERLLEHGAEIEARDQWHRTPLMRAIFGRGDALFLVDKGADIAAPDPGGRVALHWAAASVLHWGPDADITSMVTRLIEKGTDVDVRDGRGRTPLHWAAAIGNPQAAAVLLERGANPSAADQSGKTPLDLFDALPLEPAQATGGVREYPQTAELIREALKQPQ